MMMKIVAFLAWYRAYAPRVGRAAVPTLAQISSRRSEAAALVLLAPGMAALAAAVWYGEPMLIRTARVVVALGALAFGYALARVLGHLVSSARQRRTAALTVALP